jgi:phosphoglycolate phosphatase-like HAD superfamily hydrolase
MLLLFDIDGTLLAPVGAGQRAMAVAGRALFGAAFTLDGIDTSGKIDPQIFAEVRAVNTELEITESDQNRLRDRYLQALDVELETRPIPALPGAHDLLAALHPRSELTLGLLTGNFAAAAPRKLRSAGFDPATFTVNAFGDEAATRPELVPVAQRRYRERHGRDIAAKRVVVIGDTPRDVACAHANGSLAVAVATGRWSRTDLEATGAELVIDDLVAGRTELEALLAAA